MKGYIAARINTILLAIEILTVAFYISYLFNDFSLSDNKDFLGRLKQDVYRQCRRYDLNDTDYMEEFEKAFPYKDEVRGLVGNNWFSKTLDFCIIPIGILIFFADVNFNLNYTQLVHLKYSILFFIISLILMIISFINKNFYVDQVSIPDKDIYIFDSFLNWEIKKRLEKIKLYKVVYIAGNFFYL
jgi:hypothetical protein